MESQTYYSFVEDQPSSITVVIKAGGRIRDASTNKIIDMPTHIIRFNRGIYHTDVPEVIAVLDKYSADVHSGITKDRERFLAATLPKEKQVERLQRQVSDQNRLLEELQSKTKGTAKAAKETVAS